MNRTSVVPQYMQRFQCRADACEDSCCGEWEVPVDRAHFVKLQRLMRSPAEREELARTMKVAAKAKDSAHATITFGPDGRCPFVDGRGLCSIHGRHGEEALPNTCAQYPRLVYRVDARQEVWGTISCPEIARQCLLHEDALDLVDLDRAFVPRQVDTTFSLARATPYERYLDDIRANIVELLSLREFDAPTRLFFVAYFGKRTAERFHQGVSAVDEAWLAGELERMRRPEVLTSLAASFGELEIPAAVGMALVTEILAGRRRSIGVARLVRETLAGYGLQDWLNHSPEGALPPVPVDGLLAAYSARRDRLMPRLRPRLDLYFENYAKNYWLMEWHTRSPNLLVHAQKQILRSAIIRFLLLSHPGVDAVAQLEDETARHRELDKLAVEVFYRFSRAVEHAGGFLDLIQRALESRKMMDFAHTVIFAKL